MDSNVKHAEADWPPVIVAGGFHTGVVLMRNLQRRGLRVYCIDTNPKQPAFRTIYGKALVCPNPDDQPAEWLAFMQVLAVQVGGGAGVKPVLIASSDRFVTAFSEHASEIEKQFLFCYASVAVHGLLATKKRQYDVAGEHGLPVPRTQFVQSEEDVRQFAEVAQFPCLIKPLHFREWKVLPRNHPLFEEKLALAGSPRELYEKYALAAKINPEVVVQEIIEGPDINKLVYLSCYDRNSNRIGACMVRQVRTAPISFGSASVVEPVSDPETDRMCDRFLRSLGYAGICEIELKRDQRDGRVKMIEANPRYSVTADAAYYAGVDIGWLHYLDVIGKKVEPVEAEPRDFRHICIFRDFDCIPSYRKAGLLTWRELIRSYRPPVAFFDLDLRDWRVAWGTIKEAVRLILRPFVRRIVPRKK